jgi:hypothetical protein
MIHSFAACAACLEVANVPFYNPELRRWRERSCEYVVEIGAVASREVVNADDLLAERQ